MDIEKHLREIALTVPEGQLRAFACKCCHRLLPLFAEPAIKELISFGEARSKENAQIDQMPLLRQKTSQVYDSLYPSHGDPSPATLALSAAGEVAFTDSSLVAAINSTEFVAMALAKHEAIKAADADFDSTYDAAYDAERSYQYDLFRTSFH